MYFYLTVAFTMLFILAVYAWIKWYFSPYRDIPSPFAWPFIGHTPYFIYNDAITTLSTWAEKFKEPGLFKLNVLSEAIPGCTIILSKTEFMKEVLSRSDKYTRMENVLRRFFPLLGHGLLASHGEHHRFQKKLLGKAFSMNQMKYYVPVFDKQALVLVKIWQSLVKGSDTGENVIVKPYFTNLSFDIIGEIGFGYQFNSQTTAVNPFVTAFRELTEGVLDEKSRFLLKYIPFLKYLPFGPAKVLKDTNDAAGAVLDMVVEAKKVKIATGDITTVEENDLLAMMLTEKDEKTGQGFSDQLVKDNCYTFFLGGHETTATTLPGILMYLAKYPDWQERCREEIKEIFSVKTNFNLEELNMLHYTSAFIKESIRLFAAVPQIGRISTEEVTLGRYHFPKNTKFQCITSLANTDESFDNANMFLPERYLKGSEIRTGTSLTFGYGGYSCIGKNFSIQELKVVVTRLLQHFKFSIDPGNETFIRQQRLTLLITPPIKIRVQVL